MQLKFKKDFIFEQMFGNDWRSNDCGKVKYTALINTSASKLVGGLAYMMTWKNRDTGIRQSSFLSTENNIAGHVPIDSVLT